LRAIAGIHAAYDGGVEKLGRLWPSGQSAALKRGGVQLALRLAEPDFLRKLHADVVR
jgi:hypothetical protein